MSRKKSRIYTRSQGGPVRYYADFRDYADVGGTQEALKAPGQGLATTDPTIAEAVAARRVQEYQEARQRRVITGQAYVLRLDEAAAATLVAKAASGQASRRWLVQMEMHLRRALEHFGPDLDVASVTPLDVEAFSRHLSGHRGLGPQSVRHHLHSLSGIFRHAVKAGAITANPVREADKPKLRRSERPWLETPEAAVLLSCAQQLAATRPKESLFRQAPQIVGTLLLTGARLREALGLRTEDIDLERGFVHIRPNEHRGLKTEASKRSVPLWPQLRDILEPHVRFRASEWLLTGGHWWEENDEGRGGPPRDVRKLFDRLARDTGLPTKKVRAYPMRHAYVSARLQTLDEGQPVSPFTVMKEAGHGSLAMIERVYGHVGKVRHRSEVVEFRLPPKDTGDKEAAQRA